MIHSAKDYGAPLFQCQGKICEPDELYSLPKRAGRPAGYCLKPLSVAMEIIFASIESCQ